MTINQVIEIINNSKAPQDLLEIAACWTLKEIREAQAKPELEGWETEEEANEYLEDWNWYQELTTIALEIRQTVRKHYEEIEPAII
ncbi:MAG: hypothetical protein ACO3EZ_18515 [Prochlorotrichaceae cyanobacterium]|jgi:hypothetical protein